MQRPTDSPPAGRSSPTPSPNGTALTLGRVEAAAQRIAGIARRTGLLSSSSLDAQSGCRVVLKPELMQRTGSFKFRGALNRLLQASPAELASGVVAFSSGNHGAAVALAASIVGAEATVVVPADAAEIKLRAIRGYGATVRCYDPASERREDVAAAIVAERGALLVPPFDDLEVMAGQGTVGLELVEDAGELEAVLVPVGGGGLIAGVATAVRSRLPRCRIIGVEPAGADDTRRSFAAGARTAIEEVSTVADGLRASMPGALTFPINRALLDGVVVVDDEQIVEAMRFCFERLKIVVEPSGAVGVAALLSGAVQAAGQKVGVVLSGGNVGAERFCELIG